jgi:hypothetical protein
MHKRIYTNPTRAFELANPMPAATPTIPDQLVYVLNPNVLISPETKCNASVFGPFGMASPLSNAEKNPSRNAPDTLIIASMRL